MVEQDNRALSIIPPADMSHELHGLVDTVSLRVGAQDEQEEQPASSALVVRAEAMGYVYAAWNPLFPDLVKIGATMRAFPYLRVQELSSWAGLPEPFQLVASIPTPEPFALERTLHDFYASVRKYGRKKEFFLLSREEVCYQFHVRSMQVSRVGGDVGKQKGSEVSKKKQKIESDVIRQRVLFSMKVKEFVRDHIQFSGNGSFKCLTTKTMYDAFQIYNHVEQFSEMNFIHFSLEVAKHLKEMLPGARHTKTNHSNGYIGVQLRDHVE